MKNGADAWKEAFRRVRITKQYAMEAESRRIAANTRKVPNSRLPLNRLPVANDLTDAEAIAALLEMESLSISSGRYHDASAALTEPLI